MSIPRDMTSEQRAAVADRWTQARISNLLARTFGRPQLARRARWLPSGDGHRAST
ncbi:hypothetical protein [Nocardia cerradoensis]|uniref:hypothetical protein n=1 Tax=Nocardia cerradoensis TaxID=85688 RepID=UPI00167BF779|nr:hypothetical protein [Nocardia cerradoensis]